MMPSCFKNHFTRRPIPYFIFIWDIWYVLLIYILIIVTNEMIIIVRTFSKLIIAFIKLSKKWIWHLQCRILLAHFSRVFIMYVTVIFEPMHALFRLNCHDCAFILKILTISFVLGLISIHFISIYFDYKNWRIKIM